MPRTLPRMAVLAFATLSMIAALTVPVAAQDRVASAALGAVTATPVLLTKSPLFPATPAPGARAETSAALGADFSRVRRPALLPTLYASTVALQALDAHSTMTALDRGAHEANPLMKGVAGSGVTLLAVKAGAAAGTIYLAEKLWRRHRVGAIAMMVVVNGVTAAVVAHNYRVAARLR